MMTAQELLEANHIRVTSYAPGRYYTTCPECSAKRSKAHQTSKCLGVTIEADGARWGCNHCGWTGPEKGNGKSNGHDRDHIEATYDYVGFQKIRYPKGHEPRFSIRRSDGRGGWLWGAGDADTNVLYRRTDLDEAIALGHAVLLVEGEKDADSAWRIGIPATCNSQGASQPDKAPKWKAAHSAQLKGADVIVIPDHDPAGYAHADATCRLSLGIAKRVRLLKLADHWPDCPKGGDLSDWLADCGTREELDELIVRAPDYTIAEQPNETEHATRRFEPVGTYRDPATLPRRHWVYGKQYIIGHVSTTIADGGIGKTNLSIAEGIALATGRNILGVDVPDQVNVLYWNGEEPIDEIERRVHAICLHHSVDPAELTNKFFMMSGLNPEHSILIARLQAGNLIFDEACIAGIEEVVTRLKIGLLIFDPFVSLHRIPESDNTNIEAVVGRLAVVANRRQIAIDVDHHVRKPQGNFGGEISVADARGASALVNKARTARVLNRMMPAQAQAANVDDHRKYIRCDNGKANYALPPFAATWFKIVGIELPNGDNVGALEPWKHPGAFDAVKPEHIEAVRARIRSNDRYQADSQSPDWVGRLIAEVVDLDAELEADRISIKKILKTWIANGVLFKVARKDETRRYRDYVTADRPKPDQGDDNVVPFDFGGGERKAKARSDGAPSPEPITADEMDELRRRGFSNNDLFDMNPRRAREIIADPRYERMGERFRVGAKTAEPCPVCLAGGARMITCVASDQTVALHLKCAPLYEEAGSGE